MQHATRNMSESRGANWPQGAIVQSSLAESVYERLLAMVVHGDLLPGDEITAFAVAQQFGVSRTPVVEAIRRLVSDGLLEQTLNRTPRVATFTRKDIEDVYEMRMALESLAVENATRRIATEDLLALRDKLQVLKNAPRDEAWVQNALDCDIHFHEVLASACGNARLEKDIHRYRLLVRGFCRMSGSVVCLDEALQEHLEILEAMERRDPSAAKEAMIRHIRARLIPVLDEVP
jgi:DNA-binding GntR family transcriptional regulator